MSDSRQIVAVNIGSNRITMGVFARAGKKLTLSRYASRVLPMDSVGSSPRLNQVGATVADLAAQLGVKGGALNYAVSGQDVFIRFIKLPPITNADVDQLVRFEAQQQIPVPIDEIIWDYHLLPGDGLEQEVLLVAIKAEALNSMNDEFMSLKYSTGHVDSSVTALYNAYRDSYPDERDPVMIIDIGAKTTDIIYSEAGKFFTRSVSGAGVFVTSAIARDMNISFAEAEELKVSRGMVSMTNGQTEGMEADAAALATSIRNAMTRVASEIQRTTNHYRAQIHGNAPVKAYLCGGGALLPYTKEFLEERLGVPIQFFNPLHNVGVGSQVNVDSLAREALLLGGVIGTALGVVERVSINIDLEPTVVGKMREAGKKLPKVVAGVAVAILGAGVFTYVEHQALQRAKQELADIERVDSRAKSLQRSITQNERQIRELDEKLQLYSELTLQRYGYMEILKRFVETAQSDAYWIVDFDPVMGYDPMNPNAFTTGVSVIKDTYATDKATSLVTTLPEKNQPENRGRRGMEEETPAPLVNAIRLKGFSRLVRGGEKAVQDLRSRIEQEGDRSLFTFKRPDGSSLDAREVLSSGEARATTSDGVPFTSSFTLILPLKTPLPVQAPKID